MAAPAMRAPWASATTPRSEPEEVCARDTAAQRKAMMRRMRADFRMGSLAIPIGIEKTVVRQPAMPAAGADDVRERRVCEERRAATKMV
jgi:hypothetical protein